MAGIVEDEHGSVAGRGDKMNERTGLANAIAPGNRKGFYLWHGDRIRINKSAMASLSRQLMTCHTRVPPRANCKNFVLLIGFKSNLRADSILKNGERNH